MTAASDLSQSRVKTYGLEELVELYLGWHSYAGHTASTITSYRAHLKLFLGDLRKQKHSLSSQDLTPFDLIMHLAALKEKQRSPRYLKSRHQHVTTFCLWAESMGYIAPENNPAHFVPKPKVPKVRKGFMKPEWFAALVDACTLPDTLVDARRLAILMVFSTTGMRKAELCSLEIADLDWEGHLIRIRSGKGQKERRVPFHPETERTMLDYLGLRNDELNELWVTKAGMKLSYSGLGQDLERLVEKAGLTGMIKDVCHIYRRTWAANSVRQKIHRPYIMAVAGWSTPDMLDLYIAEMATEEEEAQDAYRDFDPFFDQKSQRHGPEPVALLDETGGEDLLKG